MQLDARTTPQSSRRSPKYRNDGQSTGPEISKSRTDRRFFCFTFPLRHSRCKRKHTVFDLISFPPQGTHCTATDMGIHRDYLEILSDDDRIDFRSLHILSSPSDSRIQKLYECMSFSSTPSPRSRHHGNRHSHLLLPRRAHGQHPLQISPRTCRN